MGEREEEMVDGKLRLLCVFSVSAWVEEIGRWVTEIVVYLPCVRLAG